MLKYKSLVIVLAMIFMFSGNILSQDQTRTTEQKKTSTQNQPRVRTQEQNQKQNKEELKTTMEKMHSQMMNTEKTGDPNKDFAQLMSEHHKAAIEMSQQVVQNGKNQEVKDIANKIIEENNTDLEKLSKYDNTIYNKDNKGTMNNKEMVHSDKLKEKSNMMGREMKEMMEQSRNVKTTGNLDKDYASFMILHHKESIKMSQDYLNSNKNGEFASIAQNIIKNSKNDISKLEKFSTVDQMSTRDIKKKDLDKNSKEEKREVK
ncbi:MAG TPA: DUF305 domain-containing protein [Ignavibacteriaceae bacterium]|nr:DUF305 domain-containing protein [Ignavibacteriaceae bacterium]